MAKNKTKKEEPKADRTIQYIGLAVIVLVLGFFAWRFIPRSKPSVAEAVNTTNGTTGAMNQSEAESCTSRQFVQSHCFCNYF